MATDNRDSSDGNPLLASLGRTGSAPDLLGRALEVIGGRAGEAIAQAVTRSLGTGTDKKSWIEALLAIYRNYLGEVSTALPSIAQHLLNRALTVPGDRLLLRIADPVSLCGTLSTTEKTLGRIVDRAQREGISPYQLLSLLEALPDLLEGGEVRDLPTLFDRLKYDFRRRGRSALPGIRKELLWLLGNETQGLYKLVDALTQALGQRCVRKVLRREFLIEYAKALKGTGGRIHGDLEEQLRGRFANAGLELSPELTLLAYRTSYLLLDHGHDRMFEIRKREGRTEVYGAQEGGRYTVDKGPMLLLPVRVLEASQGVAVWHVDKHLVQGELDQDQSVDLRLRAWDIGASQTPVMLFVVDYREGDLGPYLELGLGCLATPEHDPLAVGMYVLGELPVNQAVARDAGVQIWGYPKVLKDMEIRYDEGSVTCWLRNEQSPPQDALVVTLPRGGENSSGPMPVFSYTLKKDAAPEGAPEYIRSWHRTVITRTGSGEALHPGSKVNVTIPAAGARDPLCELIKRLGLVDHEGKLAPAPRFATWTERMTAEVRAPQILAAQDTMEVPRPHV